jgi:hypothetical protein
LSFSDPDRAELKAGAQERSSLWFGRDVVGGDRFCVLRWVGKLWSGRVDGKSHEGVGVCEIQHVWCLGDGLMVGFGAVCCHKNHVNYDLADERIMRVSG